MRSFKEVIVGLLSAGYSEVNVEEKLAQDIVLKALSESGLRANVTVKGGVVMATLTKDIRRTTMDLDIDFIHYSLADESIDALVAKMNCIEGVDITRVGDIQELRHQDYSGKRIFLSLTDQDGYSLQYKLDIGIHTVEEARQQDMDFDLHHIDAGFASLLANSPEQVFVEKLKSLLRLGALSSRGKDVYDLVYLSKLVSTEPLSKMIKAYIYDDPRMRENSIADIIHRLQRTFSDRGFIGTLANRKMNWLQMNPTEATARLLSFIDNFQVSHDSYGDRP